MIVEVISSQNNYVWYNCFQGVFFEVEEDWMHADTWKVIGFDKWIQKEDAKVYTEEEHFLELIKVRLRNEINEQDCKNNIRKPRNLVCKL